MAVTIESVPQLYTPSDNPVVFTFSSNQTANVNFVYYIEVYVGGILSGNHLVFPENGIYAHFDATDYATVSCGVPYMGSNFHDTAANNTEIYIKVYERYGTPPVNQASATSSTINVFKASLSDSDFIDWDYTDYAYGLNKKWLTLFPTTSKYFCSPTEQMWTMFLTNNQAGNFIEIYLYDSNGSIVASDSVSINAYKFTIFNLSQASIIAATTITQLNFDDSAYYEVYLDIGATATQTFRIYIDYSCDRYITKRFLFLSSIGSIECFSYILATEETRSIKRYGFEKQFGQWNDSNQFVFNTTDGRQQDYLVTSSGKMTVTSDWIELDVQNWLVRELYEAPFVLMIYSLVSYRVQILNSSYIKKKIVTDGLVQEIVEVGLSDARKSVLI